MPRFHGALALAGLVALAWGCRTSPYSPDPTADAVHIPRLGQTEPYSRDREKRTQASEESSPKLDVSGRFGGDVLVLQRMALHKWANRNVHETLDAIDVDAVLTELAERSKPLRGEDDFGLAVRTALCKLGDGNFRLVPRAGRGRWLESGLRVQWLSGDAVVVDVDEGRFSGRNRPRIGDVVVEVDGDLLSEYMQRACIEPGSTPGQRTRRLLQTLGTQYRVDADRQLPQKLGLRRSNDRRYSVDLDWRPRVDDEEHPCIEARTLQEGKVGILTVQSFSCGGDDETADARFDKELEAALSEVAGVEDLVVDLRDNPGGRLEQAQALAAALIETPIEWTRSRQREPGQSWPPFKSQTLQPAAGSKVASKPLWLLLGPGCAGTCELLAGALSMRDGVTTLGLPTAGSVGDPTDVRLEKSGFTVTVPRVQYALPGTDELIEGKGVAPLVEVATTVTDIRRGRDPVMEAAFERK